MNEIIKFFKRNKRLNWTLFDQAMVSIVNFLVSIFIARFLGIKEFGVFTLLWMSVLFIQSIQMAVISTPMMSIGPKQDNDDKFSYYGAVITHQIIFSITSSTFLYFSIILSDYFAPHWNIVNYAFFLSLIVFLSQNQDFIRRLFFIEKRVLAAFFSDLISYGGRLAVLIVLFITRPPSLNSVFLAISITLFISVVSGSLMLYKPSFDYQNNLKIFKRHWKMSKWLTASALMQWLSGNYFIVVAGSLFGPIFVGALRVAGNIIGIVNVLFLGLENIVPQSASRVLVASGIVEFKAYLMKVFIFGGSVIILIAILLSTFSEQILILLYGAEYANYGYILIWYSMIYIIAYSIIPLTIGLRTLENTRPIFTSYLITTIFSILSANILVATFELTGVMFGMLINNLIMFVVLYVYFRKSCRLRMIN